MAMYCPDRVRVVAVVATLMLLNFPNAAAAAADPPAAVPPVAEKAKWPDCKTLENTTEARASVIGAYLLTPEVRKARAENSGVVPNGLRIRKVRLRDEVVVEVKNLDNLLRRRECAELSGVKKSIVLYLDERPLLEVAAHPPVDPELKAMIFPLKRTEKSREVWTHLLGRPKFDPIEIAVSLGIDDEFAIPTKTYLTLEVVPRRLALWLLLGFIALAGAFFWLSMNTGLLRDTNSPVSDNSKKPWSLARVQAAWWFFIILMSYVFIGIITGDFSTTITGTTLALLGIAAGTTLTSAVIDKSKDTPSQQAIDEAAKKRVADDITKLEALPAPAEQRAQELLAAKKSQLLKLQGHNESFFIDILSDANGVSLHRFQIASWTLVLGVVFVCAVYGDLAMAQFSETLLGLMGLSAGTFVAMKNTEADTPKDDTP